MSQGRGSGWRSGPWGGVLAVALLLAADAAVFRQSGLWEWLDRRIGWEAQLQRAGTDDRLLLARPHEGEEPAVYVVGTSRARDGVATLQLSKSLPDVPVVSFAHPGLELFAVRALADELAPRAPAAVVLMLSEYDTHRPLRAHAVPGSGVVSLPAVLDLVRLLGPARVLRHRGRLLGLAVAAVLDTYRYRSILHQAGLAKLVRFETPPHVKQGFRPRHGAFAGEVRTPPRALQWRVVQRFPGDISPYRRTTLRHQALLLYETAPGPHVPMLKELARKAVHRLVEAGTAVVIVETPLHPLAQEIFDRGLRDDFVRFARELAGQDRVFFLPLEEQEPFEAGDFSDLIHVSVDGRRKLTRSVRKGLTNVYPWLDPLPAVPTRPPE